MKNNIISCNYVENNNIIFETTGSDIIYYLREVNGNLTGFKYNDDTYYYVKNGQEDIIGILDSNLDQRVSYEYDSWGNIISMTDNNEIDISNNSTHIGNINPFRYRSYYYDKETNLYYLNSRYYNPVWGRFLNADGYITTESNLFGYNMFVYTDNNPKSMTDSNGDFALFAAIIGIVALALTVYDICVAIKKPSVENIVTAAVGITPAGKITKTVAKATKVVTKVETAYDIGKRAEDAVSVAINLEKNTKQIIMGDNLRIPDFTGGKMDLFVRPNTKISSPLKSSEINIRWDVPFE